MNKKLVSVALLSLLFVGLAISAEAEDIEKGYISVNKSMTRDVLPNQAEISIVVETSDKSLKQASEDNKTIATKVNSNLKALLSGNDYIKTGNYSVRPQYIYTKDNKKVLDKYVVTNSVLIRTKNTALVSKLIDTALAQGATNIDNLEFSSDDYDTACNSAMAELTKKAYSQAETIAKSINSQIIGVKSINTSCNQETTSRPAYGMMMKASMENASATPIQSGKLKIFVNIDASFYVK